MSIYEPMAFRYILVMVGYGLPKNDGRLVLIKRQRRARPGRARMLLKLTNTFFIPNVTFGKSSNSMSNNKLKRVPLSRFISEEQILINPRKCGYGLQCLLTFPFLSQPQMGQIHFINTVRLPLRLIILVDDAGADALKKVRMVYYELYGPKVRIINLIHGEMLIVAQQLQG
jgi:hypothetical protein